MFEDHSTIFDGDTVTAVPAHATEYGRKMPGQADANGDHCSSYV